MLRLLFVLALCLVATPGCGPETPDDTPDGGYTPPPPPPPPPSVSSDFNGRWVGTAVMSSPGQTPYQQDGVPLTLSASGQTLTVSGICPDGSGSFTATGQGRTITWSGDASCTYTSSNGCTSTTRRYTSATISLDGANTLSITGNGSLSGCGLYYNITHSFTGRK